MRRRRSRWDVIVFLENLWKAFLKRKNVMVRATMFIRVEAVAVEVHWKCILFVGVVFVWKLTCLHRYNFSRQYANSIFF